MNVLDVLEERGYLKQMSHPDEIREYSLRKAGSV